MKSSSGLQEFAWSERELPGRLQERRSGLSRPSERCRMDSEPMFCFETSLKMLYWSMLVYRLAEVSCLLALLAVKKIHHSNSCLLAEIMRMP